jgi:hypothetical protein
MIRFVPFRTTPLYVLDSSSPGGDGYFAYFLWKAPDTLPAMITINESWEQYTGFYLFLRSVPADDHMQTFIDQLSAWLQAHMPDPVHTGLAWVDYDVDKQQLNGVALAAAMPEGEQVVLAGDMQFAFYNYSLPLKKTAPVATVRDTGNNITGFTFEYPPFAGAPPPRQAFNIQVALTGPGRGTLQGQVSLGDLSNNVATGWNASLYYVVRYEEKDVAQNYPLFNLQEKGLQVLFEYRLDPIDPKNTKRSYLAFTGKTFILKQETGGNWVIEDYSQNNQLPSYFRTIYGKKVNLIPITTGDHPAKLVFESLPPQDGHPRYYLAPDGDFEMVVPGYDTNTTGVVFQLLGGLSGAEHISFRAKALMTPGDIMRFQAGQPAYAPVFPVLKKTKPDNATAAIRAARAGEAFARMLEAHRTVKAFEAAHPGRLQQGVQDLFATGPLLTDTYKTSWINIRPNPAAQQLLPPQTHRPGGRGKPLTAEHLPDIETQEDLEEVYENERRKKALAAAAERKPGRGVPLTRKHLPDIETAEDLQEIYENEKLLQALSPGVPVYFSQPNDAALYDHDAAGIDIAKEILQLRDTAAAYFTEQVQQSIPLVSYAGVKEAADFTYDNIRLFELQVIAPFRREMVSAISLDLQLPNGLAANTDYILTTTPQGLLATVPKNGLTWQSVLLAKSEGKGILYNLGFENGITKELRDTLQSNQLFLVASEAAPLGDFKNKITIADWPFTINTGKGSATGNFSNVLIFKFGSGTLEERVRDPKSWVNAGTFNENPMLVANWITTYIENAKLSAENNDRFKNFVDIVQNPAWNGILALQVDIGVEAFPDDLKGLLAGIDRSQFFAHHFGIEINFIKPDSDGKLELPQSSLFGLINYVDRGYRSQVDLRSHLNGAPFLYSVQDTPSPVAGEPAKPLYDFKVLTLQVVFANSDIRDFTSKIQLTTTTWFGEAAQLDVQQLGNSMARQNIEINGSYEKHNNVRTYTFVTAPGQVYRFLLQSQTMNYVEIVKAQFNTLKAPGETATAGLTENVYSRFSFWGYMNFQQVKSFDIYSFGDVGNPKGQPGKGLYFSNLAVEMNFKLDLDSGLATERIFYFVPDNMSFDISLSTARSGSLFTNFPIRLAGLIYSKDGDAKPSDEGFLPVSIQSPEPMGAQGLSGPWFSLVYDLNLGSMGALAAKAGFLSQIATAWSPDPATRRMATGIKLPGVGGGQKTLSLQSVLNINIQSFTFISETITAEAVGPLLAYRLRFNNVKLSLLGKKLPGAADTLFILFGDPEGNDKTTLAWFAAYFRQPTPPPGIMQ